ncbi:AAA family ATPase [Candidatus Dependentiae bacterium]|nr:AAA family ATPase [Candidatus Dependentiae bacterium]
MSHIQIKKRWYLAIALLALGGSSIQAGEDGLNAALGVFGDLLIQGAQLIPREAIFEGLELGGRAIRGGLDYASEKITEHQEANRETFRRLEEDKRREDERLHNELLDETLPADYRAQLLKNKEANHQAFLEAKRQALEQDKRLGNFMVDGAEQFKKQIFDETKARLDHGRKKELELNKAIQKRKAAGEKVKETFKGITQNKKTLVAMFAGGVAAYYGISYGAKYIDEQMRLPELAQETSLIPGYQKLSNWITGAGVVESNISDVILEPGIAQQVNTIAESLTHIVRNNSYLPNIMLWGPPGTGKTMVAKRLARSCGLDYIYFSASDLDKFSLEDALENLTGIFKAAESNSKKVMVIIDEAEVALVQRRPDLPEKTRKIITHLLTYTGTETRDYMIVIMTNRPEDIDEAVLSRIDAQLFVGIPKDTEREGIIKLYINKFLIKGEQTVHRPKGLWDWMFKTVAPVVKPVMEEDLFTEKRIRELTKRLAGFTGRDISKFVLALLSSVYTTADNKLTWNMVETIVQLKLNEKKALEAGFERKAIQ